MSLKIPYLTLKEKIKQALLNAGLTDEQAEICAEVHTQSSADGIESHGLNRVPRLIEYINKGWINLHGKPTLTGAKGAVENYDGNLGLGIINAIFCTDRVMELARIHGIGCVALKNTTHWMRGGTYAWRMAESGFAGICWTNTESCMPLWGSDEEGVGNNPFCIAIPREDGPVVLDMAMSQFSYGKIGVYRLKGEQLPYPGGFDVNGNLTTDPGTIEKTRRILPAGYWKGSGMAIALDLAAALMANGNSGSDMDERNQGSCTGCCQIFIAYDPYLFGIKAEIQKMLNRRIEAVHSSHPEHKNGKISYPGERTLAARKKSNLEGIEVNEKIWNQVCTAAYGDLNITDTAST